jgi:hypothetical protein
MARKFAFTLVLFFASFHQGLFSQFQEIEGAELERYIISNHQNGKDGFEGLYTKMTIQVEDFDLLKKHYDVLKSAYSERFQFHSFYLDTETQRAIVIYPRSLAKKTEFLKIFKEVMYTKLVLLYLYEESVLVLQ